MDLSSILLYNIETLQFLSNLHCLLSCRFCEQNILPFPWNPSCALCPRKPHNLNALALGGFLLHLNRLCPENMMPEVTSHIYKVCSLFDQNTSFCLLSCAHLKNASSSKCQHRVKQLSELRVGRIWVSLQVYHVVPITFIPTLFLSPPVPKSNVVWTGFMAIFDFQAKEPGNWF